MKAAKFQITRLIRPGVRELKPYSSARDEYLADGSRKIFMDANENPFDNGLNRYPDPQQRKLKTVIAEMKSLSVENLLLGNGSDEVLDLIFRAFCEPGVDNIITTPPTYGMYKVLAGINGVENREVILNERFELNLDEIFKMVDQNTKIICLCSPNNPTGNSFLKADLKKLIDRFTGLIVLDEAYIDFSEEESWLKSLMTYPNLIVTQTMSKAYGMAGIRLGLCWGSVEIIEILNRIKPPYNVNELTQNAALEKLTDQETVSNQIDEIIEQRNILVDQLGEIPFISEVFKTDANFVLVRVDDANRRYKEILDRGIVVRNRSSLPLCENTLRFTIGTATENIELIEVLKSI